MSSRKFISPEIENNTIEELSKQLIKANAELKKLQEEREMMFANISHDLRAPMNAIRSALDLALSGDRESTSSDELWSALEMIDRRSKTLESLVNDMYYLYSVSNVPNELKLEEIEVVPFLEEYYYDLQADSKYDTFNLELDIKDVPEDAIIRIDAQKIVRVLDNLFTNAARHSNIFSRKDIVSDDAGDTEESSLPSDKSSEDKAGESKKKKPCIRLGAKIDTSYSEGKLIISVSDNGCGIPEKDLPFVFMRTYTVSTARTPETGSSGLGLSIAKAIVEKHDGVIECKSKLGKGTEFLISLPCNISGNSNIS